MHHPTEANPGLQFQYSICTIVSRRDEYDAMLAAYERVGFFSDMCEFIYVDNTDGNKLDAYAAYNRFALSSKAAYILFCHQDVLPVDNKSVLDEQIALLSELEPKWAICGNSGVDVRGRKHLRISDPHGHDQVRGGPFPARVQTLDENFLIIKREANIGLSIDTSGFHWYGTELCIIAEMLGRSCFVINYHVVHKSAGNFDESYFTLARQMAAKYRYLFRSRWMVAPTEAQVYLSASRFKTLYNRSKYKVFGKKRQGGR